jgi:hypothetical protein
MLSGVLFALVASDSTFAIDLYVSRERAEAELAAAVADEPRFADLLSVLAVGHPASAELLSRPSFG